MRNRRFVRHGISARTNRDFALITRMKHEFGKDAVALTVVELTNQNPRLRAPRVGKELRVLATKPKE